jgi:hypothetical protein
VALHLWRITALSWLLFVIGSALEDAAWADGSTRTISVNSLEVGGIEIRVGFLYVCDLLINRTDKLNLIADMLEYMSSLDGL